MSPYRYTIDDAVLQVFASGNKRQRQELLHIFDFLAREPFTPGDGIQSDRVGRHCQIKLFGAWLVTYWPEHLTTEIHILDIERVT
jgi:hypothetical protein